MCQVDANDTIDNPLEFFEGDIGKPVPSDLGFGTEVWSRQDGAEHMISLWSCSKEDSGDTSSFTVELSVLTAEGCMQSAINHISTTATLRGNPIELPCDEVREVNGDPMP